MKNFRIKTSFVGPDGQKARTFYDFYFDIHGILLQYDAIYDFSVLLRIGSNPEDFERIESQSGNILPLLGALALW